MGEKRAEIDADILAVSRIDALPTLLKVLCETTGMGFAAVARVSEESWTACAVEDGIGFGVKTGGQLDVNTTLCVEARATRTPIVIDHASIDPRYCNHHTPKMYQIESYVSVPIVLASGRYFGNLCAIDKVPAKVSDGRIVLMFERFAQIIAFQLDNAINREVEHAALLDERAASELREQFIAILGHDLRNPLQGIFASASLLEKKLTDPALISVASRVKSNARRMSSLIDDVLDFARGRLGTGIGVQIKEEADIEKGLMSVINEFQDAQPERIIVSNINVSRSVRCDVGRVQQMASNLIGNALTHGSKESPVRVLATVDDADLIVSVWNDGVPIPQMSMTRIFEPFWRQSTAADRHGLGLGLHICAQIVRAHGGKLSVTSTAESGTQFTARLPL